MVEQAPNLAGGPPQGPIQIAGQRMEGPLTDPNHRRFQAMGDVLERNAADNDFASSAAAIRDGEAQQGGWDDYARTSEARFVANRSDRLAQRGDSPALVQPGGEAVPPLGADTVNPDTAPQQIGQERGRGVIHRVGSVISRLATRSRRSSQSPPQPFSSTQSVSDMFVDMQHGLDGRGTAQGRQAVAEGFGQATQMRDRRRVVDSARDAANDLVRASQSTQGEQRPPGPGPGPLPAGVDSIMPEPPAPDTTEVYVPDVRAESLDERRS